MRSSSRRTLLALAVLGASLAACSPEARRERGDGPGADVGNHGWPVQMHGDADPVQRIYFDTPLVGKGIQRSGSAGAIFPQP